MKKVILGIENIDNYANIFEGKRVGLITNPTGITSDFVSSIDVLRKKTNLVALSLLVLGYSITKRVTGSQRESHSEVHL